MGKNELLKILEKPKGHIIAVDMDGVLCEGVWWGDGDEPKPIQKMIDKMWWLYKNGAHLIIYTARQPRYYPETHAWLIKHQVPFHGITMCMKPGANLYIDDLALNTEDI